MVCSCKIDLLPLFLSNLSNLRMVLIHSFWCAMTSWREFLSLNSLIVGVVTSSWMDFLALTWLERRPMDPMWHEWNDPNMIQLWNFVNQKMFFRIGTIYLVHIRGSLLMAQPAVLCYTRVSPLKKLFCEQRLRHDDCEGLCLDLIVEGLWRHFRRSVTTFPRIRRANCTHRFQWSQIFANLCKISVGGLFRRVVSCGSCHTALCEVGIIGAGRTGKVAARIFSMGITAWMSLSLSNQGSTETHHKSS